ncbi:MAG: pyruvate formate lyase family protein [Candidatus Bathyarchaeia archaeon]
MELLEIDKVVESKLTGSELLKKSPRVERLYALFEERRTREQKQWGGNLTVLDDPDVIKLSHVLRRAKALEKTLLEMPIAIEEDDLIVGNTVEGGVIVRPRRIRYATEDERKQAVDEGEYIEATLSHKTPYYPDVLEKGLSVIIAKINGKIADIINRSPSKERDEKLALFHAMRLECRAVVAMANRYADLAEHLSNRASSSQRREELLKIAEVCRRVPEFSARTFHEAVQSFWFVNYALLTTRSQLSCGRLDQYLYPTLKRELDEGMITLEEAQEFIDCLWLRFNDRAQILRENFYLSEEEVAVKEKSDSAFRERDRSAMGSGVAVKEKPKFSPYTSAGMNRKRFTVSLERADAINHWGQNILLSGIRPDGVDGTNALTYICLNALEKFALTSPVTTVRLHKDSPHELIIRTVEVLKKSGGQPFINNDEPIIQGYVDLGVPLEDARDYANSNCWETMIQGKSDQELIRGINFLLYLELALNRGVSRVFDEKWGPDTGDPRQFADFQDLMDAWMAQTDYQLEKAIDFIGEGYENDNLVHSGHGKYCYNSLLSAVTYDCISKEKDVLHGGARYIIWHLMGEAFSNAVDAMAAIKKFVFEEKIVTMNELLMALEADWNGYENLRRRLVSYAPKFGNGNDYADAIGLEMMDYFVERSRFHAASHPIVTYPCSVGTFSWYQRIGMEVGATPDGRHSGEAIAANFSPAWGAAVSGPTAAIRSCVKMRPSDLPAGAPLDLRFSGSALKDEKGTQRLAGLIKSFIDLGGNMITLSVTDIEDLKRAMKEPEKYRHLRVRMGGWTAYWVMLDEKTQRLHLQRIEQGLA